MTQLNANLKVFAGAHTDRMEWEPSPSPCVWRKRLELAGEPESGRVTSVVRYAPGSSFPVHPHPDGEEILVLDGVFSDERGDYPAGMFLLNPEGFSHAPFSRPGCRLFVKLRQYPGADRRQVLVDTNAADWEPDERGEVASVLLYREAGFPELIRLVRLPPGASLAAAAYPGGLEIFVIEGTVRDETGRYEAGSWARHPPGSRVSLGSKEGCVLYAKSGHLAGGNASA